MDNANVQKTLVHNPQGIEGQVRQGDVLTVRVESVPDDATPHQGPVILAHGEVTGHAHQIHDRGATLLEAPTGTYLSADALLTLTHQEHAPLPILPGVYQSIRQEEWSDDLEPRRVLD